jgi:octaprenyl-diphosphate synthase
MARARSALSSRRPTTPPPALGDLLAPVEEELSLVEREFRKCLSSDVEIIRKIGRYLSEGGGKRIRPALLLLCARMAGYRGNGHVLFATVFELIHTATLIHDDVIDGSALRRGRSTVHERWGNHLTVLLGDYLYLRAMNAALTEGDLHLIEILCDITLDMIEGEIIQARLNGRLEITEEEHLEIMRRKTALLFSGCSKVAGLLAALPGERVDDLASFGLNLGMGYQIIDDLLDFTADAEVLGKPVANDLREGRLTLPLIYLLEEGEERHLEMVRSVLEDRDFKRVSLAEIVGEMDRCGTLERTRSLAIRYCERARALLASFPASPARSALEEVCGFITARSF